MYIKQKKNIPIIIGFALLIYLGILFFADFNQILTAIIKVDQFSLLHALFFIIISLFIKFIRWHYYIKRLDINISFSDSILVFTSGFIMSITPGKVGELFKAYLIKNKYQISFSKTSSIIFAERVVEFSAILIITVFGIFLFNFEFEYIYILSIFLIILLLLIFNKKLKGIIYNALIRSRIFKKRINNLEIFSSSLKKIFRPGIFFLMLMVSAGAWICEFFGFYIILSTFASDVDLIWIALIYSLSIIIGALSMFPGGLGTTEGSLTLLLTQYGYETNIAIVSTLIIRIITLWFSIFIGFIAFFIFLQRQKLGNIKKEI